MGKSKGPRSEKEEEFHNYKRQRAEEDAVLRTKDVGELDAAIEELDKRNLSKVVPEEAERMRRRLQTLRVRRATLLERQARQAKMREDYSKGALAMQKLAPRSLGGQREDADTGLAGAKYEMVGGREVLVGGSGNIPLPSEAPGSLVAPPPPSWPPIFPRATPVPPMQSSTGGPPPLWKIPPLPPRKRHHEAGQDAQQEQIPQQVQEEKQEPLPAQTQVRASIDMSKLKQQLSSSK